MECRVVGPGQVFLLLPWPGSSGLSEPPLASGRAVFSGFHGDLWEVPRAEACPRGRDAFAVGGGSLETSLKLWQAGALPGEPRAPGNMCSDAQKSVEAAAQEQGELPHAAEASAGCVLGRMATQTAVEWTLTWLPGRGEGRSHN